MLRIQGLQPLDGFRVRITLTNGSVLDLDLANLLVGPIFDSLRTDPAPVRGVSAAAGTVVLLSLGENGVCASSNSCLPSTP